MNESYEEGNKEEDNNLNLIHFYVKMFFEP